MVLKGFGKFIGTQAGSSQRGPWYNVNFAIDGEPEKFRASPEAYNKCLTFEFGQEATIDIDVRMYDRQWILRVIDVEG